MQMDGIQLKYAFRINEMSDVNTCMSMQKHMYTHK